MSKQPTQIQQAVADFVHRIAPAAHAVNVAIGRAYLAAGAELTREFARMLTRDGERRG